MPKETYVRPVSGSCNAAMRRSLNGRSGPFHEGLDALGEHAEFSHDRGQLVSAMRRAWMLAGALVKPIGSGSTRQPELRLYVGDPASLGSEATVSFRLFLDLLIGGHSDAL